MTPHVRANWFIALSVPTDSWWRRVDEPPDGSRLLAPEDIHITVAFLGPVDAADAEAAFELATDWPLGPLEVTLGDVVPMGTPGRPTAFSALVSEGADVLARAIEVVRGPMCERAGARAETRRPLPHATIARPHRKAGRVERQEMLAWARALDLGRPCVRLSHLALYTRAKDRSTRLFDEHARYELRE